ncbi:NHS actin remodeling regulator GUK-holder isoform X2 [Halictus rubicundus]|uniref:NHS actin remodeling regulator GUK-holder isoform X2 n=1 Tax=Halictus rubicundus TaxID=77578 RepID=UPI004035D8F9
MCWFPRGRIMPFVLRKVEPRYLCRGHVPTGSAPQGWPVGAELEAVANGALTVSLKQLASLLTTAENIFADLTAELTAVADRSSRLRQRIDKVEERLAAVDPKKIPVPESDICTFSARTEHFHVDNKPSSSLFTSNTRPKALRELYEAAAIVAVRGLDSLRRDGSSMDMFLCTPVLGKRRRDQSLDIESRIPAVIEDLRRWTSTEALGDVTVPPDGMSRILGDTTDDDAVDHKLPSPEEQVQAVALKFPAEIVAVDVSGRGFERMSMRRRSLLSGPENQETAVKRRSRLRRPRGKRRNTIAGTDQKEIRQAIGGETIDEDADGTISNIASRTQRSASTDILGSSKKESPTEKKSHFNTLKAWGISRLKLISPKSSQPQPQPQPQQQQQEQPGTTGASTTRRRKDKSHERKPSSSSSSGKSIASIPVSAPVAEKQPSVKLRESAVQRRERRKGSNRDDPPHSSSGNWSASSESGRASIGSETTTTTHQPRSTTTASIGTSSTSLSHVRRFKGRDTSASSSVTSEGTLTPDIIQDIAVVPFSDDGETSSVYSCDTEGYYTSFHVDSGLKTLREEEPVPQSSSSTRTNDVSSDPTSPTVENEYELFGRGSTSTTTSSAGTVCTALLAPPPPERKSSLTVVAMVHGQNQNGGESPDSGHNTSSSPVESASSPACTGRSCSEFEYSESSDLEGCERIERIRSKTAINTSRIPSMCVITPPGSDDELTRESEQSIKINENRKSEIPAGGSVLMSATVGTSKMEVINGQDKNLYATVQVLPSPVNDKPTIGQAAAKISPLSGVLGKLRGVLPGRKHVSKSQGNQEQGNADSGDYVTIADVRNNNDKRQEPATASNTAPAWSPVLYANSDIFKKDAEYVSLSELPKKPTSSLERKRQGARVTLDSDGKVVYTSDSLKRRKGAHSTFNPGPFVREGVSPSPSPLLHRATPNVRAVTKSNDAVDGPTKLTPPTSPQLGKLIIRAARSPDRASSPDYVRTPSTVVGPTSPTTAHRQVRGAYVNMQEDEDNTLLAIDSVPPHGIVQPPSYNSPPKPNECKNEHKIQEALKNAQTVPSIQREKQQNHGQQQACTMYQEQQMYPHDPRQNAYNNKFLEQNKPANCTEYHRHCKQRQIVNMHNARNQQYCASGRHAGSHQFYTLPSRRPRRDVEPPRSITPDITRGLGHGSLSAMHMYAMHGQFESQVDLHGKHFESLDASRPNRQQPAIVDVRNRFATPLGLTAHGYRFFGSSPVRDPVTKTSSADASQHNPISPARQSHENSFATSTPIGRTMPTIADRMALIGSPNCSSPTPNSGRNTPTNLVLSPTKSTMSNEELFAAIHKSKKRLNIKDDGDSPTPYGSAKSLLNLPSGNRHSWSSDMQKPPVILQNAQSSSPATSRLDFKRLLLQQSVKSGPTRLSAAEQLKLSRQQSQQQQSSPTVSHTTPLAKVLSPRSVWRFQTPRTDVLSSTIIEDTAAEEKAMKPSPENTSPISRLNARRQIDLCGDLLNHLTSSTPRSNVADVSDDVLPLDNVDDADAVSKEIEACSQSVQRPPASKNYPAVNLQSISPIQCVSDAEHNAANPTIQYSYSSTQLTPSCQKAINAFESRRISNQLARAQFLAGTPSTGNPAQNTYVRQIFRARSESPQNMMPQNVARSPSAPTLETAL